MKLIILLSALVPGVLFAQDAEVAPHDFMSEAFSVALALGGLPWAAKVMSVITLLISSMKVSVARKYVWDKLGAGKVLAAPALGLAAGVLALPQLNGPAVTAYVLAGTGSIMLHQILDALKDLPWLGLKFKLGIAFFQKMLGGEKK